MQTETAVGFCLRAGKCAKGTTGCRIALKKKTARLLLLDGSASANTREEWDKACAFYGTELVILPQEGILPRLAGGNTKVLAVTDTSFADLIRRTI